ncbi:MAG: hypothetical protein JOZ72_00465 [Alphaproteobacteria bacterium]|nr:hypothetical protein [Alphaproteobacteria bacterium]
MKLRAAVVTSGLLLGLPMTALAGPTEEVLRAMDQCAGVADKDQRLACFDQLGPEVRKAVARLPRSGPPTAEEQKSWFGFDFGNLFGSAPDQQTTPEKFGSEALPQQPPKEGEAPPPEPIDSITAKVSEVAYSPFGKFILFLDDGQVWRQIEADTEHAMLSKHGGDVVTISRGLLGSYNLTIEGSSKTYKVKRVK